MEPFLINASTGSASAGYQKRIYQRDGEAKIEHDFANLDLANATKKRTTTLRRRYRSRGTSKPEPEPEESKHDDSCSPRDKTAQESKEQLDETPIKPPRHPVPSAQPNIDTSNKAVMETKTQHRPITHHSNHIRKPDEKIREKFKDRLRSVADGIPEVHFIGEVTEGVGFKKDTFVSCKWYLEWGKSWSILAGEETSQTQYSAPDDAVHIWNHPIDVHFATASMQGWPRIIMQISELDEYGRSILSGYGFAHLPTNPGYHELEIRCWRPSGSKIEELQSFFLGTSPCLVDENVIFGKAWESRSQLVTTSSGIVRMNVNVLLRFFDEQNIV